LQNTGEFSMSQPASSGALRRALVIAFSAVTLSAAAAAPSALAANSHASDKAGTHTNSKPTTSPSSNSNSSSSSSDHSKGNAGTSGDASQPQPVSNADQNSGGANGQCPGATYCSTRDGSPSMNGNGGGQATGKPCAGCVGKADNKNPPGQEKTNPMGTFPNNGYECDHNNGIGKTNPAHTGCTSGGGTDCTTNPTAPECNGGGTDCTTNPTAPECNGGGSGCVALPDLPECMPGGGNGCVATAANNFCTDVLGEKITKTPTGPTSGVPTSVLGERATQTPTGALPFTGADIALMTALAAMTVLTGVALLAVAGRRRSSTNAG
jgi:hypothetical protein